MDDLRELYQSVILDHNRSPRNFGNLEDADCSADGYNPLCGDKLTLQLKLDADDRVIDIRFSGMGCAISTASASLMTEFARGKSKAEILETKERFLDLLTGNPSEKAEDADLGKLEVFSGVREYPARVKCATLSWHTMQAALEGDEQTSTTE
ncbi:MAG: SUF system NifU family Fe-S cluster assembly protein [Deltaproteobacteria bacterium]|nr:SUF system NifU family Fe-S cluster assembly protein [Deltaproteobacteria bacterium]MBW2725647.1 SUF system NifU family Fe-S cluster assembly protein [Deltaproteobacteria bacterium]